MAVIEALAAGNASANRPKTLLTRMFFAIFHASPYGGLIGKLQELRKQKFPLLLSGRT
jgi:hypothetical protein